MRTTSMMSRNDRGGPIMRYLEITHAPYLERSADAAIKDDQAPILRMNGVLADVVAGAARR